MIRTQSEILNRMAIEIPGGNLAMNISGAVTVGGTSIKLNSTQTLSLGEFNYTTNIPSDFQFRGITLSSTDGNGVFIPISETISLSTVESNNNFNVLLLSDSFLNGATPTSSFAFFPEPSFNIFGSTGSQLNIKVTNTNIIGVVNMVLHLSTV